MSISKTVLATVLLTLTVATSAFAQSHKPVSNEADGMCWPGSTRCTSTK